MSDLTPLQAEVIARIRARPRGTAWSKNGGRGFVNMKAKRAAAAYLIGGDEKLAAYCHRFGANHNTAWAWVRRLRGA